MTDSFTGHLLVALGVGEVLGLLPSLTHHAYLPWLVIISLGLGQILIPRLASQWAMSRALRPHPTSSSLH